MTKRHWQTFWFLLLCFTIMVQACQAWGSRAAWFVLGCCAMAITVVNMIRED